MYTTRRETSLRDIPGEAALAATRCNSGAGDAAGEGSESPTALPESEDGLLRGVLPSDRPTDGSSHRHCFPAPWVSSWGRGKLCLLPPSFGFKTLELDSLKDLLLRLDALRKLFA